MNRAIIILVILVIMGAWGIWAWERVDKDEAPNPNPALSGDNSPPGTHPLAVEKARGDLARQLLIDTNTIAVVGATEAEWPDSCLGLAREGEICAQVITPGFDILLKAQGNEYRYRANTDGSVLRQEIVGGKG